MEAPSQPERPASPLSVKRFPWLAGACEILDLCTLKQWPADKVAQTLHVKKDLVYLIKHRVSEAIKDEVRKLESEFVSVP